MAQFTKWKKFDGRFKYYSLLIHLILYSLSDDVPGLGIHRYPDVPI